MLRIRTITALALAAGAFATLAPPANAAQFCHNDPQTYNVYRGCTYVNGACVTGSGYIAGRRYILNCAQ